MLISLNDSHPSFDSHLLLGYIANLELEVDRLRKQSQFVQQEAREALKRIRQLIQDAAQPENLPHPLAEIAQATQQFADVLRDLREPSGYHPAHDQVVAIAVRPLIEQVFRWQQRLLAAQHAVLQIELESECVEWFPARLRHILDNLISNALRYCDPEKNEMRVSLGLRVLPEAYELRVSDNGLGMPWDMRAEILELSFRAGPVRTAGVGVGLAVVKLLVEQSGGTLKVDSGEGRGTSFVVVLPRYDAEDFLV